jgi:GR25 family glycosyltransferase involved in LPS biosynthesis
MNYDITYFTVLKEWDYKSKFLNENEYSIIELSKEWVKKGYKVQVYCNNLKLKLKEFKKFQGIDFYYIDNFNIDKKYNNLILWDCDSLYLLNENINANKIYIDLYNYNLEDLKIIYKYNLKIDNIIVKSEFHKILTYYIYENFKELEKKIICIEYGVDINLCNKFNNKFKRDKFRFHYDSSNLITLKHILKIWQHIYNTEKRATLNCYYNIDIYDAELLELLKQPGVNNFGKQPKEILLIEKQISLYHLYPTDSLFNIPYISLNESIINHCIPILSNINIYSLIPGIHISYDKNINIQEYYNIIALNIINLLKKDDTDIEKNIQNLKNINVVKSWNEISNLYLTLFNINKVNTKIHIRYINLDKDQQRNIDFLNNISIIKYDTLKRFSAINGYDLINDIKNKNYIYDDIFKILFDKQINYPKGELGCLLSHYFLLKEIKNDESIKNNDIINIFEDDILINSKINLFEHFNNIIEFNNINNDFDIIYNGGRFDENFFSTNQQLFKHINKNIFLRIKNYNIINNNNRYNWDRCTSSYIINKNNIDKLINDILLYLKNNQYIAIDDLYTKIENIKSYDQFPHTFYSKLEFNTNIQGEHLKNKINYQDLHVLFH